jgi:hypothetical protein
LDDLPGNHDLADVSPGSIFACVEAELFGIQKKDIQILVRPDKSTDESTVVVYNHTKSAANLKDALEVPDCLGVSHQVAKDLNYKSSDNDRTPVTDSERHEPVRPASNAALRMQGQYRSPNNHKYSVILPTYKERKNLLFIVCLLAKGFNEKCLVVSGTAWQEGGR